MGKIHDLALKINKNGYFHLNQKNITITPTLMLHIGTLNVKSVNMYSFYRNNGKKTKSDWQNNEQTGRVSVPKSTESRTTYMQWQRLINGVHKLM